MAKHFSEVKRELEQSDGHMAGIGQQLKLSEEARDARNAGRRLEDETDETDLIGTVKKLEDLIAEQRRSKTLSWLQEALQLTEFPHRIEAYDISNTGSTGIVASMTVHVDGKPLKRDYRKFRIRM